MSWQKFVGILFVFGGLMCSAAAAWSQSATTGAIAGEVRDTTGAVRPGVTVEAASPALIEEVRTVVTDDQLERHIPREKYTTGLELPGHQPAPL